MEGFKQNTIEKSANYEGDHTLLLYERLKNPNILEKLITTIIDYQESQKEIKQYDFDPEKQELVETENTYTNETKEQIKKRLLPKIEKVFSATNISQNKDSSSGFDGEYGNIAIFSLNPDTGEVWDNKQLNIIESHEKGHEIRNFFEPGESFKLKIQKVFDFSKVEIPKVLITLEEKKKDSELKKSLGTKLNQYLINQIKEYFMKPHEIIERMSQLKNYFGMKGDEVFTKQHLHYAKKNYIKDTKIDSQIKPFLDAITTEKEASFLKLINSLGI